MKYLVAVSGGVDSVVLLDMLVKRGGYDLIVAHFDHGIREDSADDARFVKGLAEKYGLPFVMKREELGERTGEERARVRRYMFLREEASRHDAVIATAHHGDDVIETIAINVSRGTGWRGVAVLDNGQIERPLLQYTKDQLLTYAVQNRLEWTEDSTNVTMPYLRNTLRKAIAENLSEQDKQAVRNIWQQQLVLKAGIDGEVAKVVRDDKEYSRYFFSQLDQNVGCELLRGVVVAARGGSPTRPQLERTLLAIKTARPHVLIDIGEGTRLRITTRTFIVETP